MALLAKSYVCHSVVLDLEAERTPENNDRSISMVKGPATVDMQREGWEIRASFFSLEKAEKFRKDFIREENMKY